MQTKRGMELAVYTKKPYFPVDGWQSLAKFHNGARYGAKILGKKIPGKRIILPDASRLFQMLDDGRLDAVIERSFIADKILKENYFSDIKRLTPPLVDLPTYGLIQKKYKALMPEITEALEQMKADGTFEKNS